MTDVMAGLIVDIHPSKAELTLFHDRNWLLIASTVSAYSLRQMLLRVIADGSTRSSRDALSDHRSSTFDIAFDGLWAEQILT